MMKVMMLKPGAVTYNVSVGNDGVIFTNQMTDYLNGGEALQYLCLWDSCANVAKYKLSKD